ncbi:MAG: response regulator receiver protein [Chloroflexi bacterium OLB15]|nr:MAG: response regulator receiver protein [Chloroflexi bacterium OLB15]
MPVAPHILYIEDNVDNRTLVRRVLRILDIDVVLEEASSALEGIQRAVASPPDLILIDLSMPGMDGLEATRRLRGHESLREVPIVALTANVMEADRSRAFEAGCDGYIGKPIDIDRFPGEVMAYLKKIRSPHD